MVSVTIFIEKYETNETKGSTVQEASNRPLGLLLLYIDGD